jgi:hypothetical protein
MTISDPGSLNSLKGFHALFQASEEPLQHFDGGEFSDAVA